MTQPPEGMGRPPAGAPQMWTPPQPPPDPRPAAVPPLTDVEPIEAEGRRDRRVGWALASVLAVVAVVGLVVALLVITDDQPEVPSPDAAATSGVAIDCEPADPPATEGEPIEAEKFYEEKTWVNSTDGEDTADRAGRWDYASCCDVGLGSAQETLNELGCSYGIEGAYESADGHLGIGQLILAFGDTGSAIAASELEFTSFRLHEESGIYDDSMETYGFIQHQGRFLILTIGSVDSDDSEIVENAQSTLEAFHVDFTSTLPY